MKTPPPMNQASCHTEGHPRLVLWVVIGATFVTDEDSAVSSVDIGTVADVVNTGTSIRHDPLAIERYETTGSVTSAT
jgi:hypothetical protein